MSERKREEEERKKGPNKHGRIEKTTKQTKPFRNRTEEHMDAAEEGKTKRTKSQNKERQPEGATNRTKKETKDV